MWRKSFDSYLRSTEAIFAEGSVLHVVALESVSEFFHYSLTEHPFAFAVDKDNARAGMAQVGVHYLGEAVDLEIEDISRRQSFCCLEHRRGMEVNLYDWRPGARRLPDDAYRVLSEPYL